MLQLCKSVSVAVTWRPLSGDILVIFVRDATFRTRMALETIVCRRIVNRSVFCLNYIAYSFKDVAVARCIHASQELHDKDWEGASVMDV